MDLRQIDLNLLVTLQVLLEERSVTAAAARLHLSQPAVSTQLRRLREIFRDELLAPSGRRLVLTPRARVVQGALSAALSELSQAVDMGLAFDPATSRRTFRIVSTDAIHASVTLPLIASVASKAPGVRIAMFLQHAEGMEEQLRDGELDLALLTPSTMPEGLDVIRLYEERFVCVTRRDHPTVRAPLDLDAFCAADHALVSLTGGGFHGVVDEALAALNRQRRVRVSVPSFALIPALLAQTDCMATVPQRFAESWQKDLALLRPPLTLPAFDVSLGLRLPAKSDPGICWLKSEIESLLG